VVAIVLGVLVLDEDVTVLVLAGIALILIGGSTHPPRRVL
jgi:drug/metabolite transporter (DMT)-like permease